MNIQNVIKNSITNGDWNPALDHSSGGVIVLSAEIGNGAVLVAMYQTYDPEYPDADYKL